MQVSNAIVMVEMLVPMDKQTKHHPVLTLLVCVWLWKMSQVKLQQAVIPIITVIWKWCWGVTVKYPVTLAVPVHFSLLKANYFVSHVNSLFWVMSPQAGFPVSHRKVEKKLPWSFTLQAWWVVPKSGSASLPVTFQPRWWNALGQGFRKLSLQQ